MSFDLMVFERGQAPETFEAFLDWYEVQTQWTEERDYDSLSGTSPQLSAWFMEMKETFPPLNGTYSLSDEEAFANEEIENRLTDYSIGGDMIFAAFGWSAAEEACELALALAKKHSVGFYDPQAGTIYCQGMGICKMRTERSDDKTVVWEQIEKELRSLDQAARGTTNRDGAFITIWFEDDETEHAFMQCMPLYPKAGGFFKKLFSGAKDAEEKEEKSITAYTVEAGTGEKIFTLQVEGKEQLEQILNEYYQTRQLPDTSDWTDSGIL